MPVVAEKRRYAQLEDHPDLAEAIEVKLTLEEDMRILLYNCPHPECGATHMLIDNKFQRRAECFALDDGQWDELFKAVAMLRKARNETGKAN